MVKVDYININALQVLGKSKIVCQDEISPSGQTYYSGVGEAEPYKLLHCRNIPTCHILLFEQDDIGREFLEVFTPCRFSQLSRKIADFCEDVWGCCDFIEKAKNASQRRVVFDSELASSFESLD